MELREAEKVSSPSKIASFSIETGTLIVSVPETTNESVNPV